MQIMPNNVISREKINFLTNSYLNQGWAKRKYANKFDSGIVLERETHVGKLSKRVETVRISFIQLSSEIAIREPKVMHVGTETVLHFVKHYLTPGTDATEAIKLCLKAGHIDENDVTNIEERYNLAGLVLH